MSDYDRWKTRSDRDDAAARNHQEPIGQPLMSDEFSVVQFFDSGTFEYVREGVGAREAVEAARHYTENVAAKLGLVERVIITDGGDYTVFEWKRGEGVTFPPECAGRR